MPVDRDQQGRSGGAPLRVGLYGMYRSVNLGDTAIEEAIMHALRERLDPVEFVGICAEPDDTARAHRIAAMEWWGQGPSVAADGSLTSPRISGAIGGRAGRWLERLGRFTAIHRATASFDLLVFSGGGQIEDYWGGALSQPLRLLLWTRSAKLRGIPVAFVGVGLDEISTPVGRFLAMSALGSADFRAFRDTGSLEETRSYGLRARSVVCPDPAFGILPPAGVVRDERAPYVLVSPIAREAWPGPEDDAYAAYLKSLAYVSERFLDAGIGVRFACSQTRMDPPMIDRVRSHMTEDAVRRSVVERVATVDEFVNLAGRADLVVASRLHGLILSLVASTPVVAIACARKVRQLMSDMGLSEYSVDLRDARSETVYAVAMRAHANRHALRADAAARVEPLRASLASTYDEVVRSVRAR